MLCPIPTIAALTSEWYMYVSGKEKKKVKALLQDDQLIGFAQKGT